jgi:CRP-like cAMP-binding protein
LGEQTPGSDKQELKIVNDISEEKELLQGGNLLHGLQRILGPAIPAIDLFISRLDQISISSGTLLIQEDQICDSIYFVEQGLLRTFLNIDEKQVNTEFFFNGEFAAAFTSFSLQKITSLNIEALEDTRLLVISRELLEEIYNIDPRWLAFGKFLFEREFIKKCQRESSFLKDNAKQRYLKLIAHYPMIEERISLKHIASYLGIQPETLSRIRSGKM